MRARQSVPWLVALLVVTALVAGTAGSATAAGPSDAGDLTAERTASPDTVTKHCLGSIVMAGSLVGVLYAERLQDSSFFHQCTPFPPTFPT